MRKGFIYFVIALVLSMIGQAIPANAAAYNRMQISNLSMAKNIWKEYNDLPETGQAIILQESSAGVQPLGDDGASLGIGHVTIPAAVDVVRACLAGKYEQECSHLGSIDIDESALGLRLYYEDEFNIRISALYFKIQYEYFKAKGYSKPWSRAVVAYNTGRYRASTLSNESVLEHAYFNYIKYRIINVRKFNKQKLEPVV